jgi:hypothetical protein
MITLTRLRKAVLVLATSVAVVGCGGNAPSNPSGADTTYGAPVDAIDALPIPAIVAEADQYVGRRVSVDGRIVRVTRDGCALALEAGDGPPLLVRAARSGASGCAWQVPDTTAGFAVATGTLHIERDTLHLSANGVQVTPVHVAEPDS